MTKCGTNVIFLLLLLLLLFNFNDINSTNSFSRSFDSGKIRTEDDSRGVIFFRPIEKIP